MKSPDREPSLPVVLLGGSWDLVSKVISILSGVISVVTLIITLVTKSHDPLSWVLGDIVGSKTLKEVSG